MTDKLPRRTGGDGDGPDDTPMERLLREAMNARAMQITAHDLRPAAPPSRRLRRLKPVYLAAVPLFGLAAAMAFGVLGFRGDTVADRGDPGPAATVTASASPSPSAVPTVEPTPSESPTATATTTSPTAGPTGGGTTEAPVGVPSTTGTATTSTSPTAPATPYTFRGVKLRIPEGWRAVTEGAQGIRLCLLSPGAPDGAAFNDCSPYGAELTVYDAEPVTWPSTGDLDASGGWGHQPNCPVWGNPHPADGQLKSVGPAKSTVTVAGRPARKSQWQVTCNAKDSFTAQMWVLPKDQVYVSAIGLKADYQSGLQAIVNSLDVSGHTSPYANDVSASVTGLTVGQKVPNDGTPVEFAVTFKNTGKTNYTATKAVVYADPYPGAPPGVKRTSTLDRRQGGAWSPMELWGLDAFSGLESGLPVSVAPGQSVTVNYRLTLTPDYGPGTLPLVMRLEVPDGAGSFRLAGEGTLQIQVVAK
ncbi:hypothetical protein ABT263_12485 [Kitasatospora sp. NPDC001603]|uniref:hypothetical protein n=1 Tax=Kitasatospora sp. NPDC001603 TaxID=3154388 RepID=UPI0033343597